MADLTGTAGRSIIILAIIVLLAPIRGGAQTSTPSEHPEDAIIRMVFDRIVDAYDFDKKRPEVIPIDKGYERIAYHQEGSNKIWVERSLLLLCRKLGKDSLNGLAAVLAHEIAHYYLGHTLKPSNQNRARRREAQRFTHDTIVLQEREADFYGGFYSMIAGYDGLDAMPRLIELIYEGYNDLDNNIRYLKRDERKNLAILIQDSLWKMIPTFRAATWLALIRWYNEAVRCYDRITESFPSREIYNNAGVAYALQAFDGIGDDRAPFVYPLEIDGDTRLQDITVSNGFVSRASRSPVPNKIIEALLDSARRRFELARGVDREYAPALINLATVNLLTKHADSAFAQAGRALKIDGGEITRIRATTVIAIAQEQMGERGEAIKTLRELRETLTNKDESDLVKANLAVLERTEFKRGANPPSAGRDENIWGIRARDTAVTRTPEKVDRIPGASPLVIASKTRLRFSAIRMQSPSRLVQFVATGDGYEGATANGITVGSGVEEVRRRYGDDPRIIHACQGWYYIYDASQIIFMIDEDDNVRSWIIYDQD